MILISDELRKLEIGLRAYTNYDEEIIKALLKAHIDGITIEDILEVARFQREFKKEKGIGKYE